MRHPRPSIGIGALALCGLVAVGGTNAGADPGLDAIAISVLGVMAAMAVAMALVVRQLPRRRMPVKVRSAGEPARIAGRRVF